MNITLSKPFGRSWRVLRPAALAWLLAGVTVVSSGCGIYRHEVLQGNFISKEQAQAVQVGMKREQVRQILGTPLITDTFRADRWDYVFTMKNRKGVAPQKYMLSVFFVGDLLARVEGADELPTGQEFMNMIGSKKTYKPRNLEATPEQLARFAENNKPAQPEQKLPTVPATTSFPPLPQ